MVMLELHVIASLPSVARNDKFRIYSTLPKG
jgi:hypothetical protein